MRSKNYRRFALWGWALILPLLPAALFAAVQSYQVTISARLALIAPTSWMIKAYPGTGSANIVFPEQVWNAKSNASRGCTVTLETATAFRHTLTPTSKRDATLTLSSVQRVKGPGAWTINIPTASTDIRRNREVARVRASSNGSGDGRIGLVVTFLTTAPGTLLEGDYQTTVVGTITAN